jgi:hypothetical protein
MERRISEPASPRAPTPKPITTAYIL